MLRPPGAKLRTGLPQIRNQLCQPFILGRGVIPSPQKCDTPLCCLLPVGKAFSQSRMHEDQPSQVALPKREAGKVANDPIGTFVPCYHIQASINEIRWADTKCIENRLVGCVLLRHLLLPKIQLLNRSTSQDKQVSTLFRVQLQDACEAF